MVCAPVLFSLDITRLRMKRSKRSAAEVKRCGSSYGAMVYFPRMRFDRLSSIPPVPAPRQLFEVEDRVRRINERFAAFLDHDFARLAEGGLPVELIRLFVDLQVSVPAERRSRELAWLRHAFEERLAQEAMVPQTSGFDEAVALVREVLGDPFPMIGLLERVTARASTDRSVTPSPIPRFPSLRSLPLELDGFTEIMREAEPTSEGERYPFVYSAAKSPSAIPTVRPLRERGSHSNGRPRLSVASTWRPAHGPRFRSSAP